MARGIAEVAREARALAEPDLRLAAVTLVAALIAAAGAGFLLSAAHMMLARSLGPEGAGLILGVALLTCAAAVFLCARRRRAGPEPAAASPEPPAATPGAGELAPLAAFVAAFVLARQLRRRQTP
jgi:hypothetical protein